MTHVKDRIEFFDGLRGVAIICVILFHAYVRWATEVPHHGAYDRLTILRYGGMGVELFFLISGFFILMTLEKSYTASGFIFRRWLRLFPGMLVCSTMIFLTADFFHERPAGNPSILSLLPGLTFVEPAWWESLLGTDIAPLEGAFWSLYVEFKFYGFACFFYFLLGRAGMVFSLALAFALSVFVQLGGEQFPSEVWRFRLESLVRHLSFEYFGWFASGASFYIYWGSRDLRWFSIGGFVAVLSALSLGNGRLGATLVALMIPGFFCCALFSPWLQRLLAGGVLQFAGFVSYPLYLLHQNILVSAMIKIGASGLLGTLHPVLWPLIPLVGIVGAAYLVARYAEPIIASLLSRLVSSTKGLMRSVA